MLEDDEYISNSRQEYNDEICEITILEKVLKSYDNKKEVVKTQYHLQESFRSGALICLICIDNAEKQDQIWNCEVCYCYFHLDCIRKWAKDSIYLQSQTTEENYNGRNISTKRSKTWSCPKCRYEYAEVKIPQEYKCFCGKITNPPFDPWLIPHSCGEKCSKTLKPECGHKCLLLCHPGPCPPCPVMVKFSCFCGNLSETRRCASKFWSCQKQCNRLLDCKQHRCQSLCHDKLCPTCPHVSQRKCQCGSIVETRPCAELNWQCNKVCGKKLSCGHHNCEQVCHKGECGECPQSQERSCPCGKQPFTLPCTETIPSCGDTCSKPLGCGMHFCMERCHKGSCPQCLEMLTKKCLCGMREKELPCSKTFTCEVKCKRIRDCKKHACNRKCCTGDCPSCEHPCGKTLRCGQHKCESRCHRGNCFPCSITHKISCTCKKTSIVVPCGRERKTPLPRCDNKCQIVSNCHHKTKGLHKCHEGKCPICKLECNLLLDCGHKCLNTCHDAVPIKIIENEKPAGPWEKKTPIVKITKLDCPPCKVTVPGICYGKHETTSWACCDLRPHSCGKKCGRHLSCSHHTCELECHVVEGAINDLSQGANCQPCQRMCLQERPEGCTHSCKRLCHPGKCDPCEEKVQTNCHCGLLKLNFACEVIINMGSIKKEKLLSCGNQCSKLIECGHHCQKMCHGDACSSPGQCRRKVAVRCPCRRLRKEFACYLVALGETRLECDKVCEEIVEQRKKKMKKVKSKEMEEEEQMRKKELEEFELFMSGRKRKRRKEKPVFNNKDSHWQMKYIFIFAFVTLFLSIFIYLYK